MSNQTSYSCLVVGASGYIGSALCQALLKKKYQVSRLFRPLSPPAHDTKYHDLHGDFCLLETWLQALKGIDIIFYLAGETSVKHCHEKPILSLKSHVIPLIQIVDACKILNIKPFIIHAGTITQAGLSDLDSIDETHIDKPITTYDLHKLWAEQTLKQSSSRQEIDSCTLRLSNVYGPGKAVQRSDRGIIGKLLQVALKRDEITYYGNGQVLRNYIYIDDVVDAFILACEHRDKLSGKHYIISHDTSHSLKEAFETIAQVIYKEEGKTIQVTSSPWPIETSPIDLRQYHVDNHSYKSITGWEPKTSLLEGLMNLLNSHKENGSNE